VLERGVVLEHETAVDPTEAYVKVYVPFLVLAREAEERRISVPLIVPFP